MSDRDELHPRRLDTAKLTPEQRAAVEARRVERLAPEYQAELARDIDAYRKEFPPIAPDGGRR